MHFNVYIYWLDFRGPFLLTEGLFPCYWKSIVLEKEPKSRGDPRVAEDIFEPFFFK